jgi:hypothetical protein
MRDNHQQQRLCAERLRSDEGKQIMQAQLSTNVPGTGQIDKVIEEMHREFRSLLLQKAMLARRIGTLKQTIKGLANLVGEDIVGEELSEIADRKSSTRTRGFTKTCRLVLMESKCPLISQEVREEIERRNPALLAHHKDPLASVTTVLSRLTRYGEARAVVREHGQRAWEWVPRNSTLQSSAAQVNVDAHPDS